MAGTVQIVLEST